MSRTGRRDARRRYDSFIHKTSIVRCSMSRQKKQHGKDKGKDKGKGGAERPLEGTHTGVADHASLDPRELEEATRLKADGPYPYPKKLPRRRYEKLLLALQVELLKVQRWTKATGQKIMILFEGRDAAGKGGTIKRFREHLNPRGARVVALEKPSDKERGQWYFQRYISQFPTAGEIVFFDRSWYNRAGVEPVMGFCTTEEYRLFMAETPGLEHAWVESGVRLFKLWFDVGRKEQQRRLEARKTDPLKQWKLSPIDAVSAQKWDEYTRARDAMFLLTHKPNAPWTVIRSDDKRRARLGAILAVLNELDYPEKDSRVVVPPDPLIVGPADEMFPRRWESLFSSLPFIPGEG